MGYLGTWAKRKELTLGSSSLISSNQTYVPITVDLSGDTDFFSELGSGESKKVAFTKSDGTTQLYAEVAYYDSANNDAIYFVSKSDWIIDSSSDTTFYVYYDSAQSDNTTYVGDTGSRTEVYDSKWKAVFHLNESGDGTSGEYIDSTSNNNDGQGGDGTASHVPSQVSGKLGKCQDFDGTDDEIIVPYDSSLGFQSELTVLAWYNIDSVNWSVTIGRAVDASTTEWMQLFQGGDRSLYLRTSAGDWHRGDMTEVSAQEWHHMGHTYDGSTSKYWTDGTINDTDNPGSHTFPNSGGDINISNSDANPYNGRIDTIMIANVGIPDDEVKLLHASQDGTLLTIGSEEIVTTYELSGTVTLNSSGVSGATVIAINQDTGEVHDSTTTDVNGDYSFTGLTDNTIKYHILVEYETVDQKYNAKSKWDITPVES